MIAPFGWLQVDRILSVRHEASKAPKWSRDHPHFHESWPKERKNNTFYISREKLELNGVAMDVAGGGAFNRFHLDFVGQSMGHALNAFNTTDRVAQHGIIPHTVCHAYPPVTSGESR
jgi:hypothetical protein